MALREGQRVNVRVPNKVISGDWLLPGEDIYVVQVGVGRAPDRVRVRCSISGVDAWVRAADLEVIPGADPVQQITAAARKVADLYAMSGYEPNDLIAEAFTRFAETLETHRD